MVAGKMRVTMGLQKSPKHDTPPTKPPLPSPSSNNKPTLPKPTTFSRSFGVYFPRASAQVQPRPPDIAELIRLVEELRDRESRLKTELLQHKLLRESVAILPVLENEIFTKNEVIDKSNRMIEELETENARLKKDFENLAVKMEENDRKFKAMEAEIADLKNKTASFERDEPSCSQRFRGLMEFSVKSNLIKSLKKGPKCMDTITVLNLESSKREDTGIHGELQLQRHSRCNSEEFAESTLSTIKSRTPRVPKPPPRPVSVSSTGNASALSSIPLPPPPPPPASKAVAPTPIPPAKTAPPPPPPPPKGMKPVPTKVRRVPEVLEFYHSLMRRDSRRDSGAGTSDVLAASNARDMIGEIENRSAHLLAIKTDVETQGDFIKFLIKEVENAAFIDIEDVVPFVKWLDDELSYLVDERAVLKHFDWPEQKADALREAAFGYCDLKKLVNEASSFRDSPHQPCGTALKKMQALLEKLEHGVYNLSRMRESASKRYKLFQIPIDWMLDIGLVSQIKLASVKLAMKYMKRVSAELEEVGGGLDEEELIVQSVRFAFRVHQFAGGFNAETMKAFSELREKARSCHIQFQNQQQQKIVSRSTSC